MRWWLDVRVGRHWPIVLLLHELRGWWTSRPRRRRGPSSRLASSHHSLKLRVNLPLPLLRPWRQHLESRLQCVEQSLCLLACGCGANTVIAPLVKQISRHGRA